MASGISRDLVLYYSSKRGDGVDICVVCFVESTVHYIFNLRYARFPAWCPFSLSLNSGNR